MTRCLSSVTKVDGSSGDLYLAGYVYDGQTSLSRTSAKEFVIRSENDDANSCQIVIDSQGNLKLRGKIYSLPEEEE